MIAATTQTMARSKWGLLQRNRALAFWGHMVRLDPQQHVVRWVLEGVASQKWRPARQAIGLPLVAEKRAERGILVVVGRRQQGLASWPRVSVACQAAGTKLRTWWDVATVRLVWRAFAHWVALRKQW